MRGLTAKHDLLIFLFKIVQNCFCIVFYVFYVLRSTFYGLPSTVTSPTNSSIRVLPGNIHCFQSRFSDDLRGNTAKDFGLV